MTVYMFMDEDIVDEEIYFGWYEVEGDWDEYNIWIEMEEWCDQNCKSDVVFDDPVYFEDEEDAVAFKLRWI